MEHKYQDIDKQLNKIIEELKRANLWESQPPKEELLNSSQPFAIDTLSPNQWLQWVLLPKLIPMIREQKMLPSTFCITPYFEECYKDTPSCHSLIDELKCLDALFDDKGLNNG